MPLNHHLSPWSSLFEVQPQSKSSHPLIWSLHSQPSSPPLFNHCHPLNLHNFVRINLDAHPTPGSYPCQRSPYTLVACPSPALSLTTPSYPHPCHLLIQQPHLTCNQCDVFYLGETKNSLSTRMNGHRSSSNNPNKLPLLVAIHTKSHQLPFTRVVWKVLDLAYMKLGTIGL